ncbi:hypothetical protein FACS189487_08850 [Campylobacterota bacterium]|nr:hypothetical protein FACS189487_08850 [Campylobacterota bacterium]
MAKEPKSGEPLNYEEKLDAAKKIIAELGKVDLPLDRAVSLFKQARLLLDGAAKLLEKAKGEYEQMEASDRGGEHDDRAGEADDDPDDQADEVDLEETPF